MFTKDDNRALDEILKNRRICRKFDDRVPSKEDVAAVVGYRAAEKLVSKPISAQVHWL